MVTAEECETPPQDEDTEDFTYGAGGEKSTTSTSFVNVDGTTLSLELTTNGGKVWVIVSLVMYGSTQLDASFDLTVNGSRLGTGTGGIWLHTVSTNVAAVNFTRVITGLAAGTYTITLQWRTSTGTLSAYAGGGVAAPEGQMFAIELG